MLHAHSLEFLRFLIAGGLATVVQYATLVGLVEGLAVTPSLAVPVAYACGACTSYGCNATFTFRHSATPFFVGFARFLIINLIGLGFNSSLFAALTACGAEYLLAQAGATGVVLFWNYLGARLFVFRRKAAPRAYALASAVGDPPAEASAPN